jgi:4-amino-4-deoxy-L-arabinose transferase-like glycosyltransferase
VALLVGKGFAYDGKTGLSEDAVYYLHLNGATGPIPTALRMPGTPLLMAAVYKVFGPHPLAAKLLNALLGTGIGICLLLLLWEIHPRKAFWAGLIWEIYPSTLFYTNLLGTEIHFTFGVVLAALLLTKTIAGNDNCPLRRALVAGLVIGCTCLIRPSTQFILCVMAVSVWYVWQQKRKIDRAFWKKTLPVAGFLMLGIAIPLSWWGYRNYRTFGEFEWQATEIGWGFFYMTQNYLSPQEEQPLDSLLTVFSRSQNEFEIARLAKEIGIRRLCRAAVKPAFVKTLIWNFLSLWRHDKDGLSWCLEFPETGTHPENAGNPAIASMYIALQRIIETGYLTICILAFFGAIGLQRREIRNPGVITMLLYFFGTCILFCVFHGQPRYHFPFMPLFCILAANSMGALRSVPRFPWLKSL